MSSLYEANSTQRIGGSRCCVLSPWVPTGMEDSFSSWQEGWPLMVHSWVPLWRIALHLKEVALSKVYIPSVEGAHNHKRIDVGVQNQDLCLSWNKSERANLPPELLIRWAEVIPAMDHISPFPSAGPHLSPVLLMSVFPVKLLHGKLRVCFPGNPVCDG